MAEKNINIGRKECGGTLIEVEAVVVTGVSAMPLKRCQSCGNQTRTYDIRCRARIIKPKNIENFR